MRPEISQTTAKKVDHYVSKELPVMNTSSLSFDDKVTMLIRMYENEIASGQKGQRLL